MASDQDDHYACDPAECPDAPGAPDGDDHYACDPEDCDVKASADQRPEGTP